MAPNLKARDQREEMLDRVPPDQQARQQVPRDLDSFIEELERRSTDPKQLDQLMAEGVRMGLVSPTDVHRIEALLQGRGRRLGPKGRKVAARVAGGVDLDRVRLSDDLPDLFAMAGITAAAVGATVVARRGLIDPEAGVGDDLLAHEMSHVARSLQGGQATAIRFLEGGTDQERPARQVQEETRQQAQARVRTSYSAETSEIVDRLRGHTSDEDVQRVLDILSHWDTNTIIAAWGIVGRNWLDDMIDNVGMEHFRSRPRELSATFRALPMAKRYELIIDYSDTGWFNGVSGEEATAILYLLQGLSRDYLERFMQKDGGKNYREFRDNLPAAERQRLERSVNPNLERRLRSEADARYQQAREEASVVGGGSAQMSPQERARARARARQVQNDLARIRGLLSTGITDWGVSDSEARQVFRIFRGLAGGATGTNAAPPALRAVVRRLESEELMEKWISNFPEEDAYASGNVGTFIQILACRPPEAAIRHATKLLSYGLFDWAVTDDEAILAYHLIRALPASAQHQFRMRDQNSWFLRMEDNLPEDVLEGRTGYTEGGYGLVDRGRTSAELDAMIAALAVDSGIVQQRQTELDRFEQEIRDSSSRQAPAVLARLVGLGGNVTRAFTRHLDRVGLIERLLDLLGERKWAPGVRSHVLTVLRHRDPVRNMAQIRDLLSYGLFDWEVTAVEARLAYQLIRALPSNLRQEFIDQDPTWFSRMDENISRELRESREFGMYDGRESGDRAQLLGQLLEPEIWEVENIGRLRMVLRMIVQAGAMEEAAPTVASHWPAETQGNTGAQSEHERLFTEMGFTRQGVIDETVVDRTDTNTWTQVTQGLDALGKTEHFSSALGWALGFRDTGAVRGLQLDELQQAMGGHLMGIRFAETQSTEDDPNRQDAGEVDFQVDQETGFVQFTAGNLPIQNVNMIVGGATVRSGAGTLDGARARIKWATNVDPESSFRLEFSRFELNDLVIVQEQRMFGIRQIAVDDFRIAGQRPDATPLDTRDSAIQDVFKVIGRVLELLSFTLIDIVPDPANIAEHVRKTFAEHTNLQLHMGGLEVHDVVDSRGGHIAELRVGTTDLALTLSKAARYRTLAQQVREQAQGRALTAAEQEQIRGYEAQAAQWVAREQEREQLLRKRGTEQGLSEQEEARLAELAALLDAVEVSGGISGGIHARDVDFMGVGADRLDMNDITMSGTIQGGRGPLDGALSERGQLSGMANIAPGHAPEPSGITGNISVRAGSVTGQNLSYRSSERRDQGLQRVIDGLIPFEQAGTIREDQRSQLEAARREMASIRPQVEELGRLERSFATLDSGQRARYRELLAFLQQPTSLRIESMDLRGATLGADMQTRGFGVGAESGTLTGVEAGGNRVQTVSATNLRVGYGLGNGGEATLRADELRLDGVEVVSRVRRLRERKAELDAIASRSAAQRGELASIDGQLRVYEQIRTDIGRLSAEIAAIPEARRDEAAAQRLRQDLARRRSELGTWEREGRIRAITVRDANVRVSGLGDVLADDWKTPTSGLTLTSANEDQPMVGQVVLEGVEMGGTEVDRIELNDLGGAVRVIDEDNIALDDLSIGDLTISGIRWQAGENRVEVSENVRVEGVHLTAHLSWHTVERQGARYREIQTVRVQSASVRRIAGSGIHARFGDKSFDLEQGSLNGIRVADFDLASQSFASVHVDSASIAQLSAAMGSSMSASVGNLDTGAIDLSSVTGNEITLSMEDLRGGNINVDMAGMGLTLRNVAGGGVQGLTYNRQTGAVRFPRIHLDELDFSRVVYEGGAKSMRVGRKLLGRDITVVGTANLLTEQERAQLPPDQRESASSLQSLNIESLVIGHAEIEDIEYRDSAAGRVIRVASGTMENIRLTNYDLSTGRLGLEVGATDLRGLDAAIGSSMSVAGNLRLGGFGVEILADDHMRLRVDDLSTDDLQARLRDGDGNINVVNLGGSERINGTVEMQGNETRLQGISLGKLNLSGIDWRAGSKHITSNRSVSLHDVRFDATLTNRTNAAGDAELASARIQRLHVGLVDVEHLVYTDGDTRVVVNEQTELDGSLLIVNIDVNDLSWSPDAGVQSSEITIGQVAGHRLAASLGSSLQANADLDARGISVTFRANGELVTRVADLSLTAGGTAGGTRFGVNVQNADTGEITVSDQSITVPALQIPSLSLTSLDWRSGDKRFRLLEGGSITLRDLALNMTVHKRPVPEGSDRSAIDRIVIHALRIPRIDVNGFRLDLHGNGTTVELPVSQQGSITDVLMSNYTIQAPENAGGDWSMQGRVGVGGIDLRQLHTIMRGQGGTTNDIWTDIEARTLVIEQISDGSKTVDLASLNLRNLHGTFGGSAFRVNGVSMSNIATRTDAQGNTSTEVGATNITGIRYDDATGNIHLSIGQASLPEGLSFPAGGELVVPDLSIAQAEFSIDDMSKLATTGGSSGGSAIDTSILDTVNGHFNVDVRFKYFYDVPGPFNRNGDITIPVRLPVTNGVINYADLENSLPGLEDAIIDFELENDELYVEWDVVLTSGRIATWQLDAARDKRLARQNQVRLRTLMDPEMASSGGGSSDLRIDRVEFNNIDARLGVETPSEIDLGTRGKVKLGVGGRPGLVGLTVQGDVRPITTSGRSSTRLRLGMDEMNVALENFNLDGTLINVDSIHLGRISDTSISFQGMTPKRLHGMLTDARARGIRVRFPRGN